MVEPIETVQTFEEINSRIEKLVNRHDELRQSYNLLDKVKRLIREECDLESAYLTGKLSRKETIEIEKYVSKSEKKTLDRMLMQTKMLSKEERKELLKFERMKDELIVEEKIQRENKLKRKQEKKELLRELHDLLNFEKLKEELIIKQRMQRESKKKGMHDKKKVLKELMRTKVHKEREEKKSLADNGNDLIDTRTDEATKRQTTAPSPGIFRGEWFSSPNSPEEREEVIDVNDTTDVEPREKGELEQGIEQIEEGFKNIFKYFVPAK